MRNEKMAMETGKTLHENSYSRSFINSSVLLYCIIAVTPFIVMYWLVPFIGRVTIGNDYQIFSIMEQIDLMFSKKMGSFPLYIPGFDFGEASIVLSLAQLYHPISHLTSIMPGYWTGHALDWNTLFRLITLFLAQMTLFRFIRRLGYSNILSFLLSFIAVYNLAMLDQFRYGASLESWTGFIFLCSAIGVYYLNPSKVTGPLFICLSTYWLVCSGHPPIMFYGMFGAGLFTLLLPFFVESVLPEKKTNYVQTMLFWLRICIFCSAGIVLSSAYLIPYYNDFLPMNIGRVGGDYSWANSYPDTLIGTLNNYFQPLKTFVGGNFGGTSLFLAGALAPLLLIFRVKIPKVIWAIWFITVFIFLHMQGDRLPVHYFFWKYFPFASNIRVAGRIAVLMPFFSMLILAWMLRDTDTSYVSFTIAGRRITANPSLYIGIISLLMIVIYSIFTGTNISDLTPFCPARIHPISQLIMAMNLILGAGTIILFCMSRIQWRFQKGIVVLICILAVVQVAILIRHGTWMEEKRPMPTMVNLKDIKRNGLVTPYFIGFGSLTKITEPQLDRSFWEPFLAKFYPKYVTSDDIDIIYSLMERSRTPDQVFLLTDNPVQGIDSDQKTENISSIRAKYSSYNRMVFEVNSNQPGFLGLAYPYSENWSATVDGIKMPVYQANGAVLAVQLPAGTHSVDFRYFSPNVFTGMVVSCAMIIIIGCSAGFYMEIRKNGFYVAGFSVLLGLGMFFIWFNSLYSGTNIGFNYSWESSSEVKKFNLAYAKSTKMGPINKNSSAYIHSSGKAVDGDYASGMGTLTEEGVNPWWNLDLSREYDIGSIKVYEGFKDYIHNVNGQDTRSPVNTKPIYIALSGDNKEWIQLPLNKTTLPMGITFNKPVKARYITITAQGYCRLSIGEVEVLPPN